MSSAATSARRGKTMLAVLLVVFALLAAAVVWVWSTRRPTQPNLDEGRAVAEKFLDFVRRGQAAAAWESTTAEFKSAQGRESFIEYVKKYPVLAKPLSFVAVQTVAIGDSPRAEYVYRSADGTNSVRLLAGNEHGIWRIDRFKVE
jgi:hypothetical protein